MNKFALGLEGQYQDFNKFRSFFGESLSLREAFKLGLGFQIVPDYLALDSYLKRTTYRFGVEYQQTPYYLNQTNINDIEIEILANEKEIIRNRKVIFFIKVS